jgi:argininosuccinate lyase
MPDLSMEGCIKGRVSYGGTAPSEVLRQIEAGRNALESFKFPN